MFIQVFQGRTSDAAGLRRQMDRWKTDLAKGAGGWLGSTAGVTADGEFIGIARFQDEQAARANSDRPEQGEWWNETSKYFEGTVAFHDCTEVDTFMGGGSDDAGFIQVIQGHVDDPAALRDIDQQFEAASAERPDMIGGFRAWHGDNAGAFTEVAYFVSEAEARKGEAAEMPPDVTKVFERWQALLHETRYLDLREPWLDSP